MVKQVELQIVGSADPKLAAALKTIGQGLMDLADALVAPGASEQPEPRPGAARSPKKEAPPPAEEPDDDEEEIVTGDNEIKLADLQKMAKDLIKSGGRPKLLKILEAHDLENVSSAPSELWPTLKHDLELVASE